MTTSKTVDTTNNRIEIKHTDHLCVVTTAGNKEHQIVGFLKDDGLVPSNYKQTKNRLHQGNVRFVLLLSKFLLIRILLNFSPLRKCLKIQVVLKLSSLCRRRSIPIS